MERLSRAGGRRPAAAARTTLSLTLGLFVLALMRQPGVAALPVQEDGDRSRLFIEAVSVAPGSTAVSQIILLAQGPDSVTGLMATLEFDGSVLAADRVEIGAPWTTTSPPDMEDGRVSFRAESDVGCPPTSSCRVGEITWRGLVAGSSSVQTTSLTLFALGAEVPSEGTESTANVEQPAATAVPADSLGTGTGIMIAALVGLLSAAVGIPAVLMVTRTRRKKRRRATPTPATVPGLSEQLARAAADYLDAFELAGDAEEDPDGFFEALARQSGPRED